MAGRKWLALAALVICGTSALLIGRAMGQIVFGAIDPYSPTTLSPAIGPTIPTVRPPVRDPLRPPTRSPFVP
jgi:hypothetical protein